MQRPKQQALALLLGALLVGGLVGYSADRALRRDDGSRSARRRAMYDDLKLATAQRATMDSLLDARNCQFDAAFRTIQPTLDSISASARVQIHALLSPDQRARFDARRKDHGARSDSERRRGQSGCRK
ncbi:MAG: hypothetical protein H0W68_08005 [Gemmatimonadaceae bacterium]|nr:hypothetical protein [Gemmatimonadaceae bacterium]